MPPPEALNSFAPNPGSNLEAAQGEDTEENWPESPSQHPDPHLLGSVVVKVVDESGCGRGGWEGALGTQLSECGPRCSQEIMPQDRSTTLFL